jgi:hypothetical protein
MKHLLTIFLIAGLLVGCSAASSLENVTLAAESGGKQASVVATKVPTLEATMENSASGSQPRAVTARPPRMPIAPASTPLQGWQTFRSSALGVAVNYPLDWSVSENDAGVKFTSPQNLVILLQAVTSAGNPSINVQNCATLINSYGQTGTICLDAADFTYRAIFKKPSDGSNTWVILSVVSQVKPTVFYQMFDSVRFAP